MKYVIVREHDDSLVVESHGSTEQAEQHLAEQSERCAGSLLMFSHGLLVAHAADGVVTSFAHDGDRTEEEVAA